jgi:6-phosphogluconolactonase/glucosamine-6-phosphate isomerase/deaminase
MDEHIFKPLGINEDQILMFFDGKKNLEDQCVTADGILDEFGPVDILVLGIGVNGHVGFNEPGALSKWRTHTVKLSKTTSTVGQKYFQEKKQLDQGITIGLKDLLDAKMILIQVVGEHKAEAVSRLTSGTDPMELPVAWFNDTEAEFVCDKTALKYSCP